MKGWVSLAGVQNLSKLQAASLPTSRTYIHIYICIKPEGSNFLKKVLKIQDNRQARAFRITHTNSGLDMNQTIFLYLC